MEADWSLALGVLIFIIAIIAAIIYYLRYKKWFIISYVASFSVLIFSIFYTWDVLSLEGLGVILLLGASAVIMIVLGKHFSGISFEEDKVHTSLKEKEKEKKVK